MWRGTMQAVRSLEFGPDERGRRGYVIESAPGHLGLMALVAALGRHGAHAALMARARHFSPLIAVTRDGGEGRVRLTRAGRVRIDYRLERPGSPPCATPGVDGGLARAGGAAEILAVGQAASCVRGRRRRRRDAASGLRGALRGDGLRPRTEARVVSAHQMGTIRMGANPRTTRPTRGRVRGRRRSRRAVVRGLYVADGSCSRPRSASTR